MPVPRFKIPESPAPHFSPAFVLCAEPFGVAQDELRRRNRRRGFVPLAKAEAASASGEGSVLSRTRYGDGARIVGEKCGLIVVREV